MRGVGKLSVDMPIEWRVLVCAVIIFQNFDGFDNICEFAMVDGKFFVCFFSVCFFISSCGGGAGSVAQSSSSSLSVYMPRPQAKFEPVVPYGLLNDTGVMTCFVGGSTTAACEGAGLDASVGRDVDSYDASNGYAGFDFTKIGSNGEELPLDANSWSCVRDNVSGLVWEIKTADEGLRDYRNTYFWNQTAAYAASVNASGLCGASDWRVPVEDELLSIVNYGATVGPYLKGAVGPKFAADNDWFINTMADWYWSSKIFYAGDFRENSYAWAVNFSSGEVDAPYIGWLLPARLVRN